MSCSFVARTCFQGLAKAWRRNTCAERLRCPRFSTRQGKLSLMFLGACPYPVLISTHSSIDLGKFRQGEDPRVPRRHYQRRCRTFPLHECFFSASFIGIKASGVRDTSFHNIMNCDFDIRLNLYVHVMLPGGTTMFQWIFEHMTKELTALSPSTLKVKVFAPP